MMVNRYRIAIVPEDVLISGWLFCQIMTLSGIHCLLRSCAVSWSGIKLSEVLDMMMDAWVRCLKSGSPNSGIPTTWPQYTPGSGEYPDRSRDRLVIPFQQK